jgi:hypothetical protein
MVGAKTRSFLILMRMRLESVTITADSLGVLGYDLKPDVLGHLDAQFAR